MIRASENKIRFVHYSQWMNIPEMCENGDFKWDLR